MEKTFTIEQKNLVQLLASMQPIISKKTALDATTSILFDVGPKELILKSTDLEISLQASCSLQKSTLDEHQAFLVSGRRIFDLAKELDGPIECTISDRQLSIASQQVHLELNIKDTESFPPFPERIENLMTLDGPLIKTMLDHVAFLIPQNNANSALNGLLLELNEKELCMTTTDGHCLAQVKTTELSSQEPRSWLIPRRAIYELKKLLDLCQDTTIFLGLCANQLVFSGECFNFFTKLLADEFPQYQAILQRDNFLQASIDRSSLVKTLRRSICLLTQQFIPTNFVFQNQTVSIALQNKEVGQIEETLSLEMTTPDTVDILLYSPYVLQGIQSFREPKLTFHLRNNMSPLIFEEQAEKYNFLYLVMPVFPQKQHTAQAQAPRVSEDSPQPSASP